MTSIGSKTWRALAAPVVLLLMVPATLSAQAQAPLPPAKDLLARHIAAIGGEDAIRKRTAVHTVGEFSLPAMGLSGPLEAFQATPNKYVARVSIANVGEVRRGFDGTTGWSIHPAEGPRLLEGAELSELRDESDLRSTLRDSALVASMETVEKTEMGGTACYRVKLAWKSGRETTDCYAVDTGLLVGTTRVLSSPMGPVDVITLYSDYTAFGPIKLPASTRQQIMGQEQVLKYTSVEFGAVDPSVFELPPEIKALKK